MDQRSFATRAVHAGSKVPQSSTQPKVPPIYAASVFSFSHLDLIDEVYQGESSGYVYSRIANPGPNLLEEAVASLEQSDGAIAYGSGMGAIAVSILAEVKSGDHIVATQVLYGGTYSLFHTELPKFGVNTSFVDFNNLDAVVAAIQPNTKILYVETISNPLMEVADLATLAEVAHSRDLKLYVDNTFASPLLCQPLQLGADLSIHSATKYLNGHSDVTAGILVGRHDFLKRAAAVGTTYGPTLSPFDAWLVLRGIRTIGLRMERHCANALELARYLEQHPKVTLVHYPGLESSPFKAIADRTLTGGYGGMLSFEVVGGLDGARTVIDSLKMVELVPSLAGVATTVSHPGKTSHRAIPLAEREKFGVGDGLIRVSVGIEAIDDIKADFEQALAKL